MHNTQPTRDYSANDEPVERRLKIATPFQQMLQFE